MKNKSEHIFYNLSANNIDYVKARNQKIYDVLKSNINNLTKNKILDVACGRGELLKLLFNEGIECQGLDYDINCVNLTKKYTKCLKGDANTVDNFFSKEFDIVICSHFLEHTENPREMINKLSNVSKKYLLIAVPNLAQLITLEHKKPEYVNRGHFFGWDHSHFKTFIEVQCKHKIVAWGCDQVILPFRPIWKKIPLINWLFRRVELNILPKFLPFLSSSIIALIEINK